MEAMFFRMLISIPLIMNQFSKWSHDSHCFQMREHGTEHSLGGGLRQRRFRGQPAAKGHWGQVPFRCAQRFGKL